MFSRPQPPFSHLKPSRIGDFAEICRLRKLYRLELFTGIGIGPKLKLLFFSLVSDEVKDWLCAEMDDERFNCLLSLLLNINITYVKQQFTQPDKTREEVKTELLQSWTSSMST